LNQKNPLRKEKELISKRRCREQLGLKESVQGDPLVRQKVKNGDETPFRGQEGRIHLAGCDKRAPRFA